MSYDSHINDEINEGSEPYYVIFTHTNNDFRDYTRNLCTMEQAFETEGYVLERMITMVEIPF